MSKRGKLLLGALLLLVLALILWAVFTVPQPPAPSEQSPASRVMEYGTNTIREEKNGRTIWELTSDSTEMNLDTQDTVCVNVRGRFYEDDGNVLEVTAPHGVYNGTTKNIRLDGGVVATTTDGAKLTGDALEWDAAQALLAAVGQAKIHRDDMDASGDRMESWDGFSAFKAIGNAHIVKGKGK